jgi:iron complex outermembrane recepter protein
MHSRISHSRFIQFVFGAALASAASWSAAAAQDEQLEEVIVTASLGEAPLSELPGSVTVLGRRQLAEAGLQHFGDVTALAPNLGFAGGTSRPRYFQIRGIGELEQYEGAPNPSVGFLIDDIDFSGIAMPAALFDVQQAEILRGPQGTAYGANAIAGLISLRSRAPVDRFEAAGELEAGNYDTYSAGIVLNNALGENTAWRIGVHHAESDGFRRNAFLGRSDTNGFEENFVRLRVVSRPSADLEVNVTALYSDADNGYDAWSIDNSRVTQSDRPGVDAQLTRALALRFDYAGWDGLSLRSVSTVTDADMDYSFDGDWGNPVLWGANGPYDFQESIGRRRRNISQDLRLRSTIDPRNGWIAGVYALHLDENYALLDLYNGDVYRQLDSDYRALSLAAYGQIDRALSPTLALSTGVRVERRDARYRDSNALSRDPVDTMVGGHLALTWQFAQHQSAYAALTRGYKAGGVNPTAADIPADLRDFQPEFLWNLELGLRTQSADGRFDSRTSVFYMRRTDQQVSSSVQPDPADPLTFVLLTDNAARGDSLGVETELAWRPLQQLKFAGTAALLRARFLDYTLEGRDLGGRDNPHAPNYQFGLTADWNFARGWSAQASMQAVDGFYFSASHDERAPSYQIANLRLGYAAGNWSATLYARNVLNEHYAVRGFFFGNEPPDYTAKRYIQNGDPRQVGLRLTLALQ